MQRAVEASTVIRAPFPCARDVLEDDPRHVVADRVPGDHPHHREIRTDVMTVASGVVLRQGVVVRFGPVSSSDVQAVVPLSWRPVDHERLLPDFQGEFVVEVDDDGNTRLVLRGSYDVPLGTVGRFGDVLVGRRLARRSLATMVEDAARRLDAEVDRRIHSVSWRPAPYPVDLRETSGSEAPP